jgi:hypothetical protein
MSILFVEPLCAVVRWYSLNVSPGERLSLDITRVRKWSLGKTLMAPHVWLLLMGNRSKLGEGVIF